MNLKILIDLYFRRVANSCKYQEIHNYYKKIAHVLAKTTLKVIHI